MKTHLKIIAAVLFVMVQTMVTKTREYDLNNLKSVNYFTADKLQLTFNDNTSLLFPIKQDDQGVSLAALFSTGRQYFFELNVIKFNIKSQRKLYFLIHQLKNDSLLEPIKQKNPQVAQHVEGLIARSSQNITHQKSLGLFGSIKNALTSSKCMYAVTFGALCVLMSRLRAV